MIRVMVVYDISDDSVRHRVSETCLDYGLDREQFSVFTGRLKSTHIRELTKLLRLQLHCGQVQVIPISADDWGRRIIIGERST
jgi:CRISPR-associated protein Cas2